MRIGVFGTGHLGKIHIKCIQTIAEFQPVGFYDIKEETRKLVSEEFGWKAYDNPEKLMLDVDIVDIVTPTISHFDIAKRALELGKFVFIEKPVTQTLDQAKELIELKNKNNLKVQVGHVERFNPAVSSIDLSSLNPMFIEVHRLASFNPRGTDVSVVMDLMIHDIDIVLHLISSEIKSIAANGVGVVSSTPDIANARIEFENGCVVNLTASRISLKQMRKMRIFQSDAYISLDFLEKKAQVIKLFDEEPEDGYLSKMETKKGERYIKAEFPEIKPTNAIKKELESFLECIKENTTPIVTLEDGYRALKVAKSISDEIENRLNSINTTSDS